ncbi:MAG: hypothetical protein AAGF84_07250 [Planctomycetota bacterium]
MSLPTPAMRPTFQHDIARPPAEVVAALDELLQRYPGRRVGLHLMLTVPESEKHFWSPYLTIELSEDELHASGAGGTHLHARFSPNPSLWTAIGFTYLSLVVIAFFALMWAAAQLLLGNTPHALWVTLGCGLCVALLWWVSLAGQRLAYEQMFEMRHALEERLE